MSNNSQGEATPKYDGPVDHDQWENLDKLYRNVSTVDFPARAREEAFHGIAGEITRAICEDSELRPEAVLAQFLCIMGNILGRGLYKHQEGRHGTLVNVAIVGNTADGAKGGSIRAVKELIIRGFCTRSSLRVTTVLKLSSKRFEMRLGATPQEQPTKKVKAQNPKE